MRKLLRFSLLTLTAGGLLLAQGRGGGGHHGGGIAHASSPMGSAPIGLRPQAARFSGINHGAYNGSLRSGWPSQPIRVNRTIGNRGYRRPGFYGYGLPYYPFLGYGDSWYDPSAYSPAMDTSGEQTAEMTANMLGEQVGQVSAEVESLRGAPPPQYSQYPLQSAPSANDPPDPKPVVLVLHSGQTLQVQNYAIMNGVLWDFSKANSRRIPLNTIDVPASEKATEAGGGSFPEESFGANPN